jgi:lysylphosphatidylglycerol synthetase-like protein (DUF2156 family)/UDP-2,3-diacylglucosamine pyrophosphatase LpxH
VSEVLTEDRPYHEEAKPEEAPSADLPELPAVVEARVPRGGRAVVVSDLHLSSQESEASRQAVSELAFALESCPGRALLVLGGDVFALGEDGAGLWAALDAHPELVGLVRAFAEAEGHEVVVLLGEHDGGLANNAEALELVRQRLGASQVALACDVCFETGQGPQRVRVVHGDEVDPYRRLPDPRSPAEARSGLAAFMEGVGDLNDPSQFPEFVASRLLYRRMVGRLWLLAVPLVALVAMRFFSFLPSVRHLVSHDADRWLVGFLVFVVLALLLGPVTALVTMLTTNRALSEVAFGDRSGVSFRNAAGRALAARKVASGYAGLVSGHTHEPELSVVGAGFYANAGCCLEVVAPRRSRLDLPRPFNRVRRCSRLELDAGAVLSVRLVLGEELVGCPALLERLASARDRTRPTRPAVVAALPSGSTWPVDEQRLGPWRQRRRIRQLTAAGVATVGLLNLAFTLVWPKLDSKEAVHWMPFGGSSLSGLPGVVGGLVLIGLAQGLRRGYRRAWLATVGVLVAGALARLVRGVGPEGALLALFLVGWMASQARHFQVTPVLKHRYTPWVAPLGLAAVALFEVLSATVSSHHHESQDLAAFLLGLTILLVLVVSRPSRERRRVGEARLQAFERARRIIDLHGGDTLDYFALRDDKSWFFTRDSFVAYSVINQVMLISPDPIGPAAERMEVWSDVMDFADSNGWSVAVLGASEAWLPVYRASGLVDVYIGDEAVVHCPSFNLQGKEMKSLRGAFNRLSKAGFTVELVDPLDLQPDLKRALVELMAETRHGEAERGYSMTLSRVFDLRDTGLLMAICFDPQHRPVAFNQYVPAPKIHGYSLDLMRRTADPDMPSGLTDFVIIETIRWMAERGMEGLGLNFATMRAIVSGEAGSGPWGSLARRTLQYFSDTMQIESLWRFNKKYLPSWRPRYVVSDAMRHAPRTSLAIARAESVSELPLLGRFLKPRPPSAQPREPVGAG